MLLLFEFEKDVYAETSLETEFVGHPLADQSAPEKSAEELRSEWNLDLHKPTIALLPGSREKEIKRILPILLHTASLMRAKRKDIQFVLSQSPNLKKGIFQSIQSKIPVPVTSVVGRTTDVVHASDMALVTSGTATLETALLEKPFFILYKAGFVTYQLAKRLIQIPHIGLVNVVSGKTIIPEFLQNDARPETIAHEALFLLSEPKARKKIVEDLKEVRKKLGTSGASQRAANALIRFLESNQSVPSTQHSATRI